MRIKILGFDCSPRKNSNSGALLQASFATAKEKLSGTGELVSEIIHLRDCDIKHCAACSVCGKRKDTGEYIPCVIKDDMADILAKMCEADGLAVATPVYFGLPSDLFSKFIMRTRVLRHQDFRLANKPVGIMAIAGRRYHDLPEFRPDGRRSLTSKASPCSRPSPLGSASRRASPPSSAQLN